MAKSALFPEQRKHIERKDARVNPDISALVTVTL